MGRRPTPTPILKLRGGLRADRHGRRLGLDTFAQKRPPCPQRLIRHRENEDAELARKEAKKAWDRLVPQLYAAGLLTDTFFMTIEMLVDSWGFYRLACSKCADEGLTAAGTKDNQVKSVWNRIRSEMLEEVTKLAGRYGLTPADIASVKALSKPQLDGIKARFFETLEGA
jgi:P27 family predicted phage terminase small subunit